ncbi:Glycosyltransferase [Candidatus Burkholderia brachyanthoides]|nr:Glycosyltransferase [Candidatus Burkholderia brachyanthoides]
MSIGILGFAHRALESPMFRKAEAIVATGMPGLYRVVAFLLIQHWYALAELGRAASAYSVAQVLSFFTAIGWAVLVLVRIPAARDIDDAVREFYRLVVMAAISLVVVCAGVFATAPWLKAGVSAVDIAVVLAGWTLYQLARHYFMSGRSYRRVIAYDVTLVAASALLLVVFRPLALPAAIALGAALTATAVLMLAKIGFPRRGFARGRFEPSGLEFGLTNFLSGGMTLSLVPIANLTDGAAFAGVISLMASFCAISALIPRAISLYRLPEMSRLIASRESLVAITARMNREIGLACSATFIANVGTVAVVAAMEGTKQEWAHLFACGLTMAAQSSVSMFSIAHSNVLMVRELGREAARINLAACSAFVVILAILHFAGASANFELALATCLAITVSRNVLLKQRSSKFQRLPGPGERESDACKTGSADAARPLCNVVLATDPRNGKGGVATVVPMQLDALAATGRTIFIPTHNGSVVWGKFGPWLVALACCFRIMVQARRESPVFHLHPGSGVCLLRMLAIAVFLRACGRRHILVYLHTSHLERYLAGRPWRHVIGALAGLSARTVVLTSFALSQLERNGLAGKAVVVPNPYRVDAYDSRRPPLSTQECLVLVMGRLVSGKGILESVRALSYLPPSFRIVVAGEGPLRDRIEQEVSSLELKTRVDFTGWVKGAKKEALLRRSRVFCLPSTTDSFGMSFIEAQCHDIPVVAFRHPPVMEVLRPEGAVVVDSLEPAALACAIMEASKLAGDLVPGSGREWVAARFGIPRVGQLLEREIHSVVGLARGSR